MTNATHDAKAEEEIVSTTESPKDEHKMVRALTVEELDTDLYWSNELWHPHGSRGAFGGQVRLLFFFCMIGHKCAYTHL